MFNGSIPGAFRRRGSHRRWQDVTQSVLKQHRSTDVSRSRSGTRLYRRNRCIQGDRIPTLAEDREGPSYGVFRRRVSCFLQHSFRYHLVHQKLQHATAFAVVIGRMAFMSKHIARLAIVSSDPHVFTSSWNRNRWDNSEIRYSRPSSS